MLTFINDLQNLLEATKQKIRDIDEEAADKMEDEYGTPWWDNYEFQREILLDRRHDLEAQLDMVTGL